MARYSMNPRQMFVEDCNHEQSVVFYFYRTQHSWRLLKKRHFAVDERQTARANQDSSQNFLCFSLKLIEFTLSHLIQFVLTDNCVRNLQVVNLFFEHSFNLCWYDEDDSLSFVEDTFLDCLRPVVWMHRKDNWCFGH